jgi:hypothetical protein
LAPVERAGACARGEYVVKSGMHSPGHCLGAGAATGSARPMGWCWQKTGWARAAAGPGMDQGQFCAERMLSRAPGHLTHLVSPGPARRRCRAPVSGCSCCLCQAVGASRKRPVRRPFLAAEYVEPHRPEHGGG